MEAQCRMHMLAVSAFLHMEAALWAARLATYSVHMVVDDGNWELSDADSGKARPL